MLNAKNIQGGQALLSQPGLQGRGREGGVCREQACLFHLEEIGVLFLVEAGLNLHHTNNFIFRSTKILRHSQDDKINRSG